jgi:hypothetical protein
MNEKCAVFFRLLLSPRKRKRLQLERKLLIGFGIPQLFLLPVAKLKAYLEVSPPGWGRERKLHDCRKLHNKQKGDSNNHAACFLWDSIIRSVLESRVRRELFKMKTSREVSQSASSGRLFIMILFRFHV